MDISATSQPSRGSSEGIEKNRISYYVVTVAVMQHPPAHSGPVTWTLTRGGDTPLTYFYSSHTTVGFTSGTMARKSGKEIVP